MIGYINFDFLGLEPNQKSTNIYDFIFVGVIISHSFKLQSIVILSIYKVEYIAGCKVKKEEDLLRYLLAKLGFPKRSTLVIIYTNDQGLITFSTNHKFYRQTKYINVRFY